MPIANGSLPDRVILGPDGKPWHMASASSPSHAFALPHVITSSAIYNVGASQTYSYRWDEAIKNSRSDAIRMRNDAWLMSLLRERQRATAHLNWHIEDDAGEDPAEKEITAEMEKIVRSTPHLRRYIMCLLEAVWYGRYAVDMAWNWETQRGRKVLAVTDFAPISGDKIQYQFWLPDRQERTPVVDGTPCILVNAGEVGKLPGANYVSTELGRAIKLDQPYWRERLAIHIHEPEDADYFDPLSAGRRFGVGVRSRVYWMWWLKSEWLANASDFTQRVGKGVMVFYYEAGNPQSEAQAIAAANQQSDNTVIVWPRPIGQEKQGAGIESVSMSMAGADFFIKLQDHMEAGIERYIVGQSMSGGSDNESGLGGTGRADFAASTKHDIVAGDADELEATLSSDFLSPMQRWNFPQSKAKRRWKFDVDKPNAKEVLDAAKTVFDMGAPLKTAEVMEYAGLSVPQEGDDVLRKGPEQGQENDQDDGQQPNGPMAKSVAPTFGKSQHGVWEPYRGPRGGSWLRDPRTGAVRHMSREEEAIQYAIDSSGHEHKGKGPGGGQFVSGNGGGETSLESSKAVRGEMHEASRIGKGKEAKIVFADGKDAPPHIKPSMVPPNWTDVKISPHADADVLVTARDKAGRIKTVYSDNYAMKQQAAKFARIREMMDEEPIIHAKIQEDLRSPDKATREAAACAFLIEQQATRPGSDKDTKAKAKAYGATTLRAEHVVEAADGVRLQFIGKEGVAHDHLVRDPVLAKELLERKRTAEERDGKLFNTNDSKLRSYTDTLDHGRFGPKDFRTLKATRLAIAAMQGVDPPKTMKDYKAKVKSVAEKVSHVLGNRPQQALESYISPTVFSSWKVEAGV